MNFFDKETRIIEAFRESNLKQVLFLNYSFSLICFYFSLLSTGSFKNWKDNSSDTNNPPDFYNTKTKTMLEVMRIDDYRKGPKHPNAFETRKAQELVNNLQSQGIVVDSEQDIIIVNSLFEDVSENNCDLYLSNFKRIVGNHIKKIQSYKESHPRYKLGFLIFDESPAYIETKVKYEGVPHSGDAVGPARYYNAPCDKRFIRVFLESDIDYVIWMTPYKWFAGNPTNSLKDVFLIDVNKAKRKPLRNLIDYNYENILCLEAE